MRLILWNISYLNNINPKIELLNNLITHNTNIVLLEVMPSAYKEIKDKFSNTHNLYYSLDLRTPSKFDGKNRQLGVLLLIAKTFNSKNFNVLNRTPFPDRTGVINFEINKSSFRLFGLHSLTGSGYKKTKSSQFLSFTEAVDKYKPDIVMIDANEPKVDAIDFNDNVYFNNQDRGKGAHTFFKEMVKNNLIDSFRVGKIFNEGPLEISYITHQTKRNDEYLKRYDHIYINTDKFIVNNVEYLYEEAITAGSDHALVICDIEQKK